MALKYGQKVRVKSGDWEGFSGEVIETWLREKNMKTYIRVQNELGNILEPEDNLEIIL